METYYPTGELKSEASIINGKKNEKYKSYYENGQLKEICYHTNGIKIE